MATPTLPPPPDNVEAVVAMYRQLGQAIDEWKRNARSRHWHSTAYDVGAVAYSLHCFVQKTALREPLPRFTADTRKSLDKCPSGEEQDVGA